jgi:5'-nucleotidase
MALGGAAKAEVKNPDDFTLTILHTNDIHANYGGFQADKQLCYQALCPGGSGGSVRLLRALQAWRAQYPHALIMDAGDEFQGSLYWTVHQEIPTVAVLNALGYQFFAPGNHDLDGGVEVFQKLVNGLQAQVISANLILPNQPDSGQKIPPYAIVEVQGRQVGVVGLITANATQYGALAKPGPQAFELGEEKKALTRAVQRLTAQGIDIIVALTHIGLERDLQMAAEVEGLDIIVGGHSHSLLGAEPALSDGPYPMEVQSPTGQPVLVVTAGSQGRYLGRLSVTFDERGQPVQWSGESWPITDQTLERLKAPPADPGLVATLTKLSQPLTQLMSQKLGQIGTTGSASVLDQDIRECRRRECRTGDVLASALLSSVPQAQVALVNGGSIRNSLPVGEVTMAHVLAAFPFANYVSQSRVSGQDLLDALAYSAQSLGDSGKFLQVAGLRLTYQGQGQSWRLNEALIQDGQDWVPLDPQLSYQLVTLDFLANGGDGYATLKKLNWQSTDQLATDVFIDYLKKEPIKADFEPRITFVSNRSPR